jgi:hypothetical protein
MATHDTFKLITETPFFEFKPIVEERNLDKPSSLYIEGPFLMAEKKNRNGRIYSIDEMITEVHRYDEEMIKQDRAYGELNHPTSAEINPERACHRIVELHQDGNYFHGRSKILNTPLGHIVKNIILDGGKLGVSSRALGRITESPDGNRVSKLRLICCDVVADPSVDKAFVNGVLESKAWILNESSGQFEALYEKLEKDLSSLPKHGDQKNQFVVGLMVDFIKQLK